MSQKVSRKSNMNEEKEKRQTVSPAKDVKKKVTSNTDKEKSLTDKPEKPVEKPEKQADKKQAEKSEKQTDKKHTEKSEKQPDKSTEKITEKKDEKGEKSKDDGAKEEKIAKNDHDDEKGRPQQNGQALVQNGEVTNGKPSEPNGTVSGDSDDDDVTLVIDDDHDQDEMFPELAYDDTSDTEGFELPTADSAPSRSLTRRSQPKESKVLKLKEDAPGSNRKLRSSDSPKPQEVKKSQEPTKKQEKSHEPVEEKESSDKGQEKVEQEVTKKQDNTEEEVKEPSVVSESKREPFVRMIDIAEEVKKNEKLVQEKSEEEPVNIEVVIEVEPEADEEKEEPRKLDTNYSKSRVKVSPYRRSSRIADQTASSMLANYTGNNTTMEMDITETSFTSDREGSPPAEDSSYLRGLRSIRARNSYKKLAHLPLTNLVNRSARAVGGSTPVVESRPTAPVVGRKRRPDVDRDPMELHHRPSQTATSCKRMRFLDRVAYSFRRNLPHALPSASPDIVGINTDLPLTAPVASADTFDPETLKATPLSPPAVASAAPPPAHTEPLATPLGLHHHTDTKRCVIM